MRKQSDAMKLRDSLKQEAVRWCAVGLLFVSMSVASESDAQVALSPKLDPAEVVRLERNSGVTSQWVDTETRGRLRVTRTADGLLQLSGRQRSDDGKGSLVIEGRVLRMEPGKFIFEGLIEIDDGDDHPPDVFAGIFPCRRDGAFTFRVTGARKYWRMKEQQGYCGSLTDYVDIFF